MEELINLRFSFSFEWVLEGMNLRLDEAIKLIRKKSDFNSIQEEGKRDIILSAIENLIEFSAASQWYLLNDLPDKSESDFSDLSENIFKRYNHNYRLIEDKDILHSAIIANWFLDVSETDFITYRTQGDERVRPWHLDNDGVTYLKNEFPPELIPPIEWGCRCFLTNSNSHELVNAELKTDASKFNVNPIFKESLAKKGRIFSLEHSYFKVKLPKQVKAIMKRIRTKLLQND